jgi:hypothetical protein
MTATLAFSLPEEQHEHALAINAQNLANTITDADEVMRRWLKHGHSFETSTEALEACRGLLSEAVQQIQS